MADIEKLVPHLLKWEAGTVSKYYTGEKLFELARKKGWSDNKNDRGGKTMCGVTLATYTKYCKEKGLGVPGAQELRNISYNTWLDILRKYYWDKWKADLIKNQSIANLLVDWTWGSGRWGIELPQRVLGVKADGIVGQKTLAAVNGGEPSEVFKKLWLRRRQHFQSIALNNGQDVFLRGWLNRLNDLKFSQK